MCCGSGLQDDIEAYKTQNKFLNSEIHQLTKLWRNSCEQEKRLMVKVGPSGHTRTGPGPGHFLDQD